MGMWGLGLSLLSFKVVSILDAKLIPFNLSWWSFSLPQAVFALSTVTVGIELGCTFSRSLVQY